MYIPKIMYSILCIEPPLVELSLAQSLPESSFLVCSAKGGSPESYQHNILLTRNETLSHTLGDHISYNLSDVFGVYTCIVESLLSTTSKTILFPQRGIYVITCS